jgi:predicted dehydrogenase
MPKHQRLTRRGFLCKTGKLMTTAAVVPTIISATAIGTPARAAASERIVMGNIGFGGRAGSVVPVFLGEKDVQMVAVCDVKASRRQLAKQVVDKHYGNSDCSAFIDLRELLARDDIDAVYIATGDSWHSLAACLAARAGKDMYCEKPMSVVIAESRVLSDTMSRHARIFQCGTQRRSLDHFQFAINLARRGMLGELKTLHAEKAPNWIDTCQTVLPPETQPPREEFDWDMWLGPAPWRQYNSQYPTRGFWGGHVDFAGGSITEWGSHTVDLCQAANDSDDTSPIEYQLKGKDVEATYANGVRLVIRSNIGAGSCGVRFEGTEGWVQVDDSGQIDVYPQSLQSERRLGKGYPMDDHARNFLDCFKTRRQPIAPAEGAHRSISTCHVANICRRLGRNVKWDPVKEAFIDDPEADRMRSRAYRQPWCL